MNAVARQVRKTHPDRYIATLAYWLYAYPPRTMDIEPNVSVSPCLLVCYYPSHPGMRNNDTKLYQEWLRKARGPMFLWVYYHHPMEAALIQGWKCFPNVMVHASARAAQRFVADGIRGVFLCGERDQLEYYVLMKLRDNPRQDVNRIMDEFFKIYFGAAVAPMREFYRRIEAVACNPEDYPPDYQGPAERIAWEHLGTARRMEKLGALMAEAQRLAATDLEKRRAALWYEGFWQWMAEGRAQYLRKQPAPIEKAKTSQRTGDVCHIP
ncbi:MAG: DUF4838 domain-containing protein [Armatimonadetes bacterium]|nr:DUF4838 domain-containing protein [Armatimonadota bacterium]